MLGQRRFGFVKETLNLTAKQACRNGLLVAVILSISAGGCSSVPDAVNPVEWYKGTRDWIAGDDKLEAENKPPPKPVPGADKPYPTLDTVPDRPDQSTAAERERVANSLVADRERARYSDEQIRRQDSSVTAGAIPRPPTATQSAPPQVASIPATPNPNVASQPIPTQVAPPPRAAFGQPPAMPNQPIAVVPVQPPANVAVAPPPAAQIPPVPSAPPPAPVVIGSVAPQPSPTFDSPPRPPNVNPAGGGPSFNQPVPPAQPDTSFVPADPFSNQFPNAVGLPQPAQPQLVQPQLIQPETAAVDATQPVPPNTPPVATLHFGDGSARLGGGDRQVIRRIYNEYRSRGGRIHVVGHASSRTRNLDQASHQLANFSISYERARAVASVLERLGVPPESIIVTAMSDQTPNYFEVMPAGEAGNRRVEIFFEN